MTRDIEPLDAALWFERVEIIAAGAFDLERSLRHASHLLQLTPYPLRHVVRLAIDEDSFEALLEAGELDAAARHLVAQPTALAIKNEGNGVLVEASISCVILKRVVTGTGPTEADAILNAWASCLLALRAEYGANLSRLSRRPRRGMTAATARRQ